MVRAALNLQWMSDLSLIQYYYPLTRAVQLNRRVSLIIGRRKTASNGLDVEVRFSWVRSRPRLDTMSIVLDHYQGRNRKEIFAHTQL